MHALQVNLQRIQSQQRQYLTGQEQRVKSFKQNEIIGQLFKVQHQSHGMKKYIVGEVERRRRRSGGGLRSKPSLLWSILSYVVYKASTIIARTPPIVIIVMILQLSLPGVEVSSFQQQQKYILRNNNARVKSNHFLIDSSQFSSNIMKMSKGCNSNRSARTIYLPGICDTPTNMVRNRNRGYSWGRNSRNEMGASRGRTNTNHEQYSKLVSLSSSLVVLSVTNQEKEQDQERNTSLDETQRDVMPARKEEKNCEEEEQRVVDSEKVDALPTAMSEDEGASLYASPKGNDGRVKSQSKKLSKQDEILASLGLLESDQEKV